MLAYDRAGSGEPLVLIHPLGADRQVWKPVWERLTAERDCIAIDLPGFGETPALEDVPSAAALARFIADELPVEHPHVAGNSIGGWVALELALLGRARTVTAIAPAGLWKRPLGPKPSVARRVGKALLPALPGLLRVPPLKRLALTGTVAKPGRVPPEDALALIRAYVEAPGFKLVNSTMRSSRFERLDEVSVPLTFGWPSRDRLIARPRRLPDGSTSVTLKGCGHVPMWDDPAAVAGLLLAGSDPTTSGQPDPAARSAR